MNKTLTYADAELDILVKSSTDPNNRPIIEGFIPEIKALVEKFRESGQSGGSAPYTAKALSMAIEKLCLHKPICPITGIDDEFVNVSDLGSGDPSFQNKRCSALFKDKDGKCWYLNAIVWKTQTGSTWSGSALLPINNVAFEKITSRQFIKGFPFEPKTFYVDVTEKEVAPDEWDFHIKDENQLKEVFEYYQK